MHPRNRRWKKQADKEDRLRKVTPSKRKTSETTRIMTIITMEEVFWSPSSKISKDF